MEYCFCTVSSKSRIYQCMALYDSLVHRVENLKFFVLCMDDETFSILSALKSEMLIPIELGGLESSSLLELKKNRSVSEYCWTMKPVFIEYILEKYVDIQRVTYLDADMYFFNKPKPIFISGFGKSIWLTPHNYNEHIKSIEKQVGRYNSGFISFKNNRYGREGIKWWKKSCIDWCYNTTVGGKFGDQKYLDDFNGLFEGVMDITVPGVNIAPWNDVGAVFEIKNGKVNCNSHKLICYHFCGFKVLSKKEFMVQFGNTCNEIIHKQYMHALRNAILKIESINPGFDGYYHKEPDENFNVFSI